MHHKCVVKSRLENTYSKSSSSPPTSINIFWGSRFSVNLGSAKVSIKWNMFPGIVVLVGHQKDGDWQADFAKVKCLCHAAWQEKSPPKL